MASHLTRAPSGKGMLFVWPYRKRAVALLLRSGIDVDPIDPCLFLCVSVCVCVCACGAARLRKYPWSKS